MPCMVFGFEGLFGTRGRLKSSACGPSERSQSQREARVQSRALALRVCLCDISLEQNIYATGHLNTELWGSVGV